jgi:CubicO group peptidase (beta-lactamase class C family)
MQAIVSATSTAARAVNVATEVGTLERGKWADFVVLDANPLDDIGNTRKLTSVWIAGNRVPSLERISPAPAARIDQIFAEWNKPDTPGASVAVIRGGQQIFAKGYGQATLEYPVPITPETIFHVASVTKQFTAMSLVLLEQDSKLSLEDDIHKYLPELPDYGKRVTIRNLLQHTSGIRDQWQTLGLAGWRLDDIITQDQILRMLFRQKELNFDPGSRHLYSNGGYSLAAEIVHRVAGKGFDDFAAERIFQPLGMARTHVHDDVTHVVPGRAYSYSHNAGGYWNAPLNYSNTGATSLFTTAPDLCKWLDNFRAGKVGGERAIARMEERAVIDGKAIDYALGVVIGNYRGLRTVSHNGADAGYRSAVIWFPDQQFGVTVLANLGNINPTMLANRVAEAYLESDMQAPNPPPPQPQRPPVVKFDPGDLAGYTGTYWSEELETQYTVRVKDGKLIAMHTHHGEIALTPTAKDTFRTSAWFMPEVKFVPGGMIAGGGRVTGIRFMKKQEPVYR